MKVKSQKASVAIFVLVALLFYMGFLLLLYANNLNKVQTITEKAGILKSIYKRNVNDDSINDIYNRKMAEKNEEIILPYEYQQVEYIESTGTQYIDTNENANNISEINIKFNLTKDIGAHQGILGGGYSEENSTFQIVFNNDTKKIGTTWGNNRIAIDYDTNIHYAKVSTTKCVIDSRESSNTSTINDNRNVYLFARRSDNLGQGIENYSYCKIYKCEMYNNNVMIHKFIPCYLKDNNEIGLYDLIGKKFYTNQGTGTFLKGNDV